MTEPSEPFDFKKYISFEATAEFVERVNDLDKGQTFYPASFTFEDNAPKVELINKALEEIASTPEGQKLILDAASKSPDGVINFMRYPAPNISTQAQAPNDILMGDATDLARYSGNDQYSRFNACIQRVLFHEMQHIALDHKGNTPENEQEAIRATNAFMSKYYNEPFRSENGAVDYHGTTRLELDKGFRPEGYRNRSSLDNLMETLSSVPDEHIDNASPELQSLYELRDNRTLLENQYTNLEESGQFDDVQNELDQLAATNTLVPELEVSSTPPLEISTQNLGMSVKI